MYALSQRLYVTKRPKVSMKNLVAIFALLLACITVKAQPGTNNFKLSLPKENVVALHFLEQISFVPTGLLKQEVSQNIEEKNILSGSEESNEGSSIEKYSSRQFKYAMMMDVEVESLNNLSLYNFINEWFGTHYRMGGTSKKGIDCSAFSGLLLASVFSLSVPRTAREQYNICEKVSKEDLLSGDLVFFNTRGGVSHVGVYLTDGNFVHSSSSQGVTISNLDESYYAHRFIGGGRVNQ